MTLKVFESFAGIGSQRMALRNLGIEHEVVAISEIDRFAIDSYTAIHGETLNLEDISQLKTESIPEHDLFTYSFPCFTGENLVKTSEGYKEIRDVVVGDLVMTHTGQYKRVSNLFDNGIHPVATVSSMGAENIRTTLNHKFYARTMFREWDNATRRYSRKFTPPEWKEVREMSTAEYVGFPVNTESTPFQWDGIHMKGAWGHYQHKNELSKHLSEKDFWWLWGRYVADGWQRDGGIVLAIGKDKVADFEANIPAWLVYCTAKEQGCTKYHFTRQELRAFSGMFGKGASNKVIPQEVLDLPVELLESFLIGYLSGDGSVKGDYVSATTVSRKLVYGLQEIVAKVYKRPSSIYKHTPPNKTIIEGRTVNQSATYMITFKVDDCVQDKAFYEKGFIWSPVRKIVTSDSERVYDIEVEDDHSFTVQNTVVHNCQDISVAGQQGGLDEGSETRSSLLWECRKVIATKKPKYLLLENVKNLVGKRHKENFDKWLQWLEDQGYSNYWQVLNAKDYGIPQNRERVFVVSILGEHKPFEFPEPRSLTLRLKDMLEEHVDEKYYLDNEKTRALLAQLDYVPTEVIKLNQVGNFEKLANPDKKFNDPQTGRVLDTMGICQALDTMGICQALDTMQGGNRQPKILIKNATKQGYLEATEGDGIDLAYPNSATRRGRVQKGISQTLQTADSVGTVEIINPLKGKSTTGWHFEQQVYDAEGLTRAVKAGGGSGNIPKVIEPPFRIRKLTPLECWRLMGFTDEDFFKAQAVNSNTQLYKQAGNSIVVTVLEGIFRNMFSQEETEWQ